MSGSILNLFQRGNGKIVADTDNEKTIADVVDEAPDNSGGDKSYISDIVHALMDFDKLVLLSDLTQEQINQISLMVVKNEHFYGGCKSIRDYVPLQLSLQVSHLGKGREGLIRLAMAGQFENAKGINRISALFGGGKK